MMPKHDYQAIADKLSALTNSEWKLEESDIFSLVRLKRDMGDYLEVIEIQYKDRFRKISIKGIFAETSTDRLSNLKIIRQLEKQNPETKYYLSDPSQEIPVDDICEDIVDDILPRYAVLMEKLFESQLSSEELNSLRLKKVQVLSDAFCEKLGCEKVVIDPENFANHYWDEDSSGDVTIEVKLDKLTAYQTLAMMFAILG